MKLPENIIKLQQVDSTNRYANKLLSTGDITEGAVVWSDYQYNGRGQQNSKWVSEAGMNLTFSIIFFPSFLKIEEQFYLSKVVSLGIIDCMQELDEGFMIKWPNDILHGKNKLAGILIECGIEGDKIKHAIAGVGLNVNQMSFDKSIPNPVSLQMILGRKLNTTQLMERVLLAINRRYASLMNGGFERVSRDYLTHLLGYNQSIRFRKKELPFTAKITGIGPTGELILKHNNREHAYGFKEVEFLL